MNKTYIASIVAIILSTTGCINCVNQSVHGDGKAVVVKTTNEAKNVVPVQKKVSTTATTSDWVLVSTTKEVISSQPVLF
jgi:hypothetical protein